MPVNGFCQFPSLKAAMAASPEAWRSTGRGNGYELGAPAGMNAMINGNFSHKTDLGAGAAELGFMRFYVLL